MDDGDVRINLRMLAKYRGLPHPQGAPLRHLIHRLRSPEGGRQPGSLHGFGVWDLHVRRVSIVRISLIFLWLISTPASITNYLVTCVALNLCLVLVFGVNVLKLEKWYIMGSFAVGIFVPIVPAALGKFGCVLIIVHLQ